MTASTRKLLIAAAVVAALVLAWFSANGDVQDVVFALIGSAFVVYRTDLGKWANQPSAQKPKDPVFRPAPMPASRSSTAEVQTSPAGTYLNVTIPSSSFYAERIAVLEKTLSTVHDHRRKGADVSPMILAVVEEDLRHQKTMFALAESVEREARNSRG